MVYSENDSCYCTRIIPLQSEREKVSMKYSQMLAVSYLRSIEKTLVNERMYYLSTPD